MPLVVFIVLILLGSLAYAGYRAAPWVPTWKADIQRIMRLAHIQPGERFFDLGCGDGRMMFAAAAHGAHATGFELSLFHYIWVKIKILLTRTQNVHIRYQDFWYTNLQQADVVYFFLHPRIYKKLKIKLEKELKPGARVIAYVWPIEGWAPTAVDAAPNFPPVYYYQREVVLTP